MQSLQQDVKRELEVSINTFERYADKSRASTPVFNPGEMVWLSSRSIKSSRPTRKFSKRWLVFHISLLELVKKSTIPKRNQEPPPPIIIKEEEEWEVPQIMDLKLKRKRYGIWWSENISVKRQKDPLGNQPKTSRIFQNLSRTFILYILTRQDPIH
ncbi:hypothetical protein O181_108275 [Austropuccinia psidii MF-1]|uniref:Uncharacterized protein n=1 Tax=Austropuccinia psidii MF-1 TaxID=1389203 RepID=A0A9Q3JS18_9BASI|nr:hypothetical protein [Austropuccinia psidii MF-1]